VWSDLDLSNTRWSNAGGPHLALLSPRALQPFVSSASEFMSSLRRVQLVREEGRDVSSQYGREGGGALETSAPPSAAPPAAAAEQPPTPPPPPPSRSAIGRFGRSFRSAIGRFGRSFGASAPPGQSRSGSVRRPPPRRRRRAQMPE